ncbi:MAG: hypothetical protein ACE15C_19285 [Phycisphaerae bacterium]
MGVRNPSPPFLRDSSALDHLTEDQRRQLRRRLEEGYHLRNVDSKCFSLLAEWDKWDTAIVLDACRFDAFQKVNFLPGRLARRISPGSCTEDWIAACLEGLAGSRLDDVAYISASPYVSRWYFEQIGVQMPFAQLEEVWRSGWDDSLHTVPPTAVIDAWRSAGGGCGRTTGRKFVLHFMQPHHPYIGAVRIPGAGWRQFFGAMELDAPQLEGQTPTEMLEDGRIDRETAVRAYESNLKFVLDSLAAIRNELSPRTVITSDHGETFGECGIFGHPCGLPMPELIEIPYLELA